jgi:hypothetical protein
VTMTSSYSPEVLALADRLKNGNTKIWDVYNAAINIGIDTPDGKERFDSEMNRVTVAVRKMDLLRLEAQVKGFTECLYTMPICTQKNMWCWGCPAEDGE